MMYDRATTLSFHNYRKHIDNVSRDAMEPSIIAAGPAF